MVQTKFLNFDIIANDDHDINIILKVEDNGDYLVYPLAGINSNKIEQIKRGEFVVQGLDRQIEVKVPMIRKISMTEEYRYYKVCGLEELDKFAYIITEKL